ncbi:hypothetical protein FN846DRAFT_936140 [Sphaerosporella brunnea]|uniref:Uncharacterized protein n=1 Tax=Sphaerosporella brunnea TaxID=1250544 RepID=A0A5J5F4R6_9PEZI|nr:hypothetical protein FN846DRAFT_936140 [Sphaerosporella brunnea]
MKTTSTITSLLSLAASVAAHGVIVSPAHRTPGSAYESVCGITIYNNQAADPAGPIQLLMQSASSIVDRSACDLWLCKGYQFSDNSANVQSYSLGETISWKINIIAPHTGYANVSIVDTKTNTVKGSALKSWDVYASTSTGVTSDETDFDITIPETLDGCTTPGECVVQWFWYAPPGVDQTYEGCVDFVVGDGAAASTSAAAGTTSTAAAATSAVVKAPTTASTTSIAAPTTYVAAPATKTKATKTKATKTKATTTKVTTTTSVAAPTTTTKAAVATTKVITTKVTTTTKVTATKVTTTTATAPTTLITCTRARTSSPAAAAPTASKAATGGAKTPQSINQCLDAVNVCIAKAQSKNGGAVDFSSCEAQRSACY